MRRYARQDTNHKEIHKAFEKLGCSVADISNMGRGIPDILVGFGGLSILIEIKDGAKVPSKQRLTPDEEKFRMNWTGGYRLVTCLEDVEETVKTLTLWHAAICNAVQIGVQAK